MIRNIIKLGVLGVVAAGSLYTSSTVINDIVIEVNSRQASITDAIIKQQVEKAFEEAEKQIEEVAKEENIEIKTEKVEMKPPEPKPEPKPKPEEVAEVEVENENPEITAEGEVTEEAIVPENPVDAIDEVDLAQYGKLTEEQLQYMTEYLIDNYFLFGYEYYTAETDPVRYERKKLTHEMEAYIINSLGEALVLSTDLMSIDSEALAPVLEDVTALSTEFKEKYKDVGSQGAEFQVIYEEANAYFEAYIGTVSEVQNTLYTLENTTNKALVVPLLMKSLNQDLLPGVKGILDQGFNLKTKTNAIYTEGIDGSFLLKPEDVVAIIMNPQSILPEEMKQTSGETLEEKLQEELGELENVPIPAP